MLFRSQTTAKFGGSLNKYGPGGQITDGCPPYWSKNSRGQCVPEGFTNQPLANSNSYVQENQKQKINNDEILRKKAALDKRQFVGPASNSTPYSERKRKILNEQYVSQLPNAKIDENSNVSRVNPNRSVTGKAENFMSRREDKAVDHISKALEVAGAIEGLTALGKFGFSFLKNGYKMVPKEVIPIGDVPEEIGGYEGDVPAITSEEYSTKLTKDEEQKLFDDIRRAEKEQLRKSSQKINAERDIETWGGYHPIDPWFKNSSTEEFAENMKDVMKQFGFDPTKASDVEKFRKLSIEKQMDRFWKDVRDNKMKIGRAHV